ncbi:MAG TPA: FxSxx-COOH system tetratricopeptide repeat protein [Pseudonocardiaceae bacterium]|nr:FxSxx-COOH system tetratricopeptide repeat protein [Pseudonocardiaceae bacterium]
MFINYRGEDSHSYGALLYTALTYHFGEDLVFLDAESIPAGADFVQELLDWVRSARVVLAVIGPRWLTAIDPTTGGRRIDDPADWIRRELAEAFTAGVRVIPVLTDEAELPREAELPADIAPLGRCQYRHLRRREPIADLARIVFDVTGRDHTLALAARRRSHGNHSRPDLSNQVTGPVYGIVVQTGSIDGDVHTHQHHHYSPAVPAPPVWPVLVGQPPALASAYQARPGLRDQILAARGHGDDVILAQHDTRGLSTDTWVLAGGGGVGKSQLAAWFARQAIDGRTADLVVWVTATSPDQVITTYARAAAKAGVPGVDGVNPDLDARALLEWLHTTDRNWLVVLDDITDPAHLAGWWPPSRPTGWTLATTRLRDTTLISSGRRQIAVDVYTPDESMAYLTDRLTNAGQPHLLDASVVGLATAVGHLPLALSHAAAYMINQEEGCAGYLNRYTSGVERLAELMPDSTDPDGYGRPVAVTLLLALDAADRAEPVGLARPALTLAAVCAPDGHPDTLWTTTPVTDYLATHRADQPVTTDQARKAIRLLHRYSLLTHTPSDGAHAVRIHALTARAAWETTTDPAAVAHTVADALLQLWPAVNHAVDDLVTTLRTNTTALASITGDLLWHPTGHAVLFVAGQSLHDAELLTSARDYFQHLRATAERILGPDDPATLTTRSHLAYWRGEVGDFAGAAQAFEQLLPDYLRVLGPDHPDTLTTRGNLVYWRGKAGDLADTVQAFEQLLADRLRVLGPDHPTTLRTRYNLARFRDDAGDSAGAARAFEQLLADDLRVLGPDHPDTLAARHNLARFRGEAGDPAGAVQAFEQLLVDRQRALGPDHPDTLAGRDNLAYWRGEAGDPAGAAQAFEQLLLDYLRVLGPHHRQTLDTRSKLADWRYQAGDPAGAVQALEQVVPDYLRVLGPDHPDTLTARNNLARFQGEAGDPAGAAQAFEQLLADCLRVLGPDHPLSLTAQNNLAYWITRTSDS